MRLYIFVLLVLKIETVLSEPKGCKKLKEAIEEGKNFCELEEGGKTIAGELIPHFLGDEIEATAMKNLTFAACAEKHGVRVCETDGIGVFRVRLNSFPGQGHYGEMVKQIKAKAIASKPKKRPLKVGLGCIQKWLATRPRWDALNICVAKWKPKDKRQGEKNQKKEELGKSTHTEEGQVTNPEEGPGKATHAEEGPVSKGSPKFSEPHSDGDHKARLGEESRSPEIGSGQQKSMDEVHQKEQLGNETSQVLGSAPLGENVEDRQTKVDQDEMPATA